LSWHKAHLLIAQKLHNMCALGYNKIEKLERKIIVNGQSITSVENRKESQSAILCLNIKDYHQIFFYSKNSFSEYNFKGFVVGYYIFLGTLMVILMLFKFGFWSLNEFLMYCMHTLYKKVNYFWWNFSESLFFMKTAFWC